MCGRFTLTVGAEQLRSLFYLEDMDGSYEPRYNIAPGQPIHAVIQANGINRIGTLRWGLIPSWTREDAKLRPIINARAETLLQKPSFERPFRTKRCLIPADGFYEWRKDDKQPFRLGGQNFGLLAFAGLYDTWIRENGEKIHTCTIITTRPNSLVSPFHDRMPVIIDKRNFNLWLDREHQDMEQLQHLLQPFPAELMASYPVSRQVGRADWDKPEAICAQEE